MCHSVQGARQPLSSRAISLGSFTVRWQGTSCSSSFVSKVLGANYNRANNFHPVADKFAMCTNGGQEVTFEPTSNAYARVDYNTCCIDLITIKPNPAAFYLRHGHYRSHCNHRNVYSQVCHHVYVLCRNEEIIEMCNDKVSATSF